MARKFIDAPDEQRCVATTTMRDGSTARCGRYKKVGDLCKQHATQATARDVDVLINALGVMLALFDDEGNYREQYRDQASSALELADRILIRLRPH